MLGRKTGWAILLIVVIAVVPLAFDFWVKACIDQWLGISLEGDFRPLLFQTAFRVNDVRFTWNERIQVRSGNLKVRYQVLGFARGKGIRVKVYGEGLEAEFLGAWGSVNQGEPVRFKTIDVDFSFNAQGIWEVYQLSADSPNLKMSLSESPRLSRMKG